MNTIQSSCPQGGGYLELRPPQSTRKTRNWIPLSRRLHIYAVFLICSSPVFGAPYISPVSEQIEVLLFNEVSDLRGQSTWPIGEESVLTRKRFFLRLAARGYAPAAALLTLFNYDGSVVTYNPQKSVSVINFLRKKASEGDISSMCAIYALIINRGKPSDYGISENELRTLADQGARAGHFACKWQVAHWLRRDQPQYSYTTNNLVSSLEIESARSGYSFAIDERIGQAYESPISTKSLESLLCWSAAKDVITGRYNSFQGNYEHAVSVASGIQGLSLREEIYKMLEKWKGRKFVFSPINTDQCAEIEGYNK